MCNIQPKLPENINLWVIYSAAKCIDETIKQKWYEVRRNAFLLKLALQSFFFSFFFIIVMENINFESRHANQIMILMLNYMKLYLCCIKLRSRTYLFYFAISMFTLCVLWFLFFIMYVLHLIVHDCISFPRQSFAIVLHHVNNLWSILWCRFQTVCYIHGDIKKIPNTFFQ